MAIADAVGVEEKGRNIGDIAKLGLGKFGGAQGLTLNAADSVRGLFQVPRIVSHYPLAIR